MQRYLWRDDEYGITTIITIADEGCRVETRHGGYLVCDLPIPLEKALNAVEKYGYMLIVDTYHRNGVSP